MICFNSRGRHRFCFALSGWNPLTSETRSVRRLAGRGSRSGVPPGIESIVLIGIRLTRGTRIGHTTFVVETGEGLARTFCSPARSDRENGRERERINTLALIAKGPLLG